MIRALKASARLPAAGLPDIALEGGRVLVRPPRERDWPQWAQVRGRNRAYLKPFEPAWPDYALERDFFIRRLARQARDWQGDRNYSFLVFDRNADELIGGINLNNVCRGAAQHASLGYWLDEQQQGQGYMTGALRLVIAYAFDDLRLHRLNAGCLAGNHRSIALLKRLGFSEEGFARRYLQIDGAWQDHVLFGLNSEDRISGVTGGA